MRGSRAAAIVAAVLVCGGVVAPVDTPRAEALPQFLPWLILPPAQKVVDDLLNRKRDRVHGAWAPTMDVYAPLRSVLPDNRERATAEMVGDLKRQDPQGQAVADPWAHLVIDWNGEKWLYITTWYSSSGRLPQVRKTALLLVSAGKIGPMIRRMRVLDSDSNDVLFDLMADKAVRNHPAIGPFKFPIKTGDSRWRVGSYTLTIEMWVGDKGRGEYSAAPLQFEIVDVEYIKHIVALSKSSSNNELLAHLATSGAMGIPSYNVPTVVNPKGEIEYLPFPGMLPQKMLEDKRQKARDADEAQKKKLSELDNLRPEKTGERTEKVEGAEGAASDRKQDDADPEATLPGLSPSAKPATPSSKTAPSGASPMMLANGDTAPPAPPKSSLKVLVGGKEVGNGAKLTIGAGSIATLQLEKVAIREAKTTWGADFFKTAAIPANVDELSIGKNWSAGRLYRLTIEGIGEDGVKHVLEILIQVKGEGL